MLTAYLQRSPLAINLPAQGSFPWHSISKDWFGKAAINCPTYRLFFNDSHILFQVNVPRAPRVKPGVQASQFIEGLWEYDVGELFLGEQNSKRYLEINLGPSGAWWNCSFTSYRQREKSSPDQLLDVQTSGIVSESSWSSSILIPRSSLNVNLGDLNQLRANTTFILYRPEPEYFTAVELKSNEPDYHLSEQFERIAVVG